MNFKRAREIFGFLRSSSRFAGLPMVSLVARSSNVMRGMCGPQCWRKALPDLCHGILARLLAFVEVRPPRCNMQHGHESHGCNDGRRSTPEFFHGLDTGCDHLRRDDCLRPSSLKTPLVTVSPNDCGSWANHCSQAA